MTTIIMIFSLPIGIYILLQEKKSFKKYQAIFDDFYKSITYDQTLTKSQKLELFSNMLHKNGYKVTKDNDIVYGQKKIFSVGWLFIGIGTLYIGLIFYIIYYLYIQKPHIVRFEYISND